MSVSLAIAVNAIAAVALLAVLAWAMARAGRLRPHEPADENVEVIQLRRGARVEVDRRAA